MAVRCGACGALLNPRANRCAVCDAPVAINEGRRPAGAQVSQGSLSALPADEMVLAAELGKAIAPSIHLRKRIGRGGMGVVFLARDESLKRDVAIKVLAPDLAGDVTTRARFIREAEAAAAVSHPNVVNIYHVGLLPLSQTPYFVMQYVEGPSIADASGRMLPEARVRRVIGEVASGLAAAHRRGVIHRDIKPGNIVIDGETGRALLLDFGISAAGVGAKRASRSDRLTSEGSYVGTPTYMSPELASGEEAIDKSDVYSLGIVAYEMLTGHPPFPGSGMKVMAAHVNDEVPDLHVARADLSPEMVELVERSLSKDPAERPSAQAIVDNLLPGSRQALEWPPPGLLPLRRAAVPFRMSLVALVLSISAFVFILSTIAPVQLQNGGRAAADVWHRVRHPDAAQVSTLPVTEEYAGGLSEAEALWGLASASGFAVMLIAAAFAAFYSIRALRTARIARYSGYPMAVVIDVMCDVQRDGGDLLSGLGVYAFTTERERHRFILWRRLRLGAMVVAAIWAVGAVIVRVSGWVGTVASAEGSTFTPRAWLWLGPVGLLAFSGLLATADAIVRRRRSQGDEGWQGSRPVRNELVANWMVSAGRPTPRVARFYGLQVEWVAGLALLVAVSSAILIANALMRTSLRAAFHRSEALSWIERGVADSTRANSWRAFDAALDRAVAAQMNAAAPLSPVQQASLLSTFIPPAVGAQSLIPRAAADSSLLVHPASAAQLARLDTVLDNYAGRVPTALIDSVASGVHPAALEVWRAVAHGALLPEFWPYREAKELDADRTSHFSTDSAALLTLASANLADGLRHLSAGDHGVADARARENLAVARQLSRGQTTEFTAPWRVVFDAAVLLTEVARAKGDRALLDEAANLKRTAHEAVLVVNGGPALFADPNYLRVADIIGDTVLAPAVRLRLVELTASGFCENPREVLFGVDPARRTLLKKARDQVVDLSGATRILAPWEGWLDTAINTGVALPTVNHVNHGGTPLNGFLAASTTLFGLKGLKSRLTYCGLG